MLIHNYLDLYNRNDYEFLLCYKMSQYIQILIDMFVHNPLFWSDLAILFLSVNETILYTH